MLKQSNVLALGVFLSFFIVSCSKESTIQNVNVEVLTTESSSTNVNLSSGLIAYYPFTGNANDASVSKFHGTVVGATLTKDKSGKVNRAYSFSSAAGNYIALPLLTPLNGATKATISFQMKTNTLNYGGAILGHWSSNFGGVGVNCGLSIGTVTGNKIDIGNFSGTPGITSPVISAATWHNIVIVIDYTQALATNKVKFYDNGVQLNLTFSNYNNSIGIATSSFFGRRHIDFGNYGDYFDGILDEIRIYNRVVNQSEITSLSKL
jgi:hypothetical protein